MGDGVHLLFEGESAYLPLTFWWIDIFSTTYLPRLVNIVKEGPLNVNNATYIKLDTYILRNTIL